MKNINNLIKKYKQIEKEKLSLFELVCKEDRNTILRTTLSAELDFLHSFITDLYKARERV